LNGFGARSYADEFETLSGLGGVCFGDFELGLSGFEIAVGDYVFRTEILLADKIKTDAVEVGFGAAQRGFASGNFLWARACLKFGECCFGASEFGAAEVELRLLLGIIKSGDELAGFDMIAFENGAFGDSPGQLESKLGVGDLDVAGDDDFVGT
jgi:hypothetical protein